jgi:hypothetical protein
MLSVAHTLGSSVLDLPAAQSGAAMKKTRHRVAKRPGRDRDTMRAEYDFSHAVRGVTAARYREGTNVVLLDPDVSVLFPDSTSVNEALRTFARLVKPRGSSLKPRR